MHSGMEMWWRGPEWYQASIIMVGGGEGGLIYSDFHNLSENGAKRSKHAVSCGLFGEHRKATGTQITTRYHQDLSNSISECAKPLTSAPVRGWWNAFSHQQSHYGTRACDVLSRWLRSQHRSCCSGSNSAQELEGTDLTSSASPRQHSVRQWKEWAGWLHAVPELKPLGLDSSFSQNAHLNRATDSQICVCVLGRRPCSPPAAKRGTLGLWCHRTTSGKTHEPWMKKSEERKNSFWVAMLSCLPVHATF